MAGNTLFVTDDVPDNVDPLAIYQDDNSETEVVFVTEPQLDVNTLVAPVPVIVVDGPTYLDKGGRLQAAIGVKGATSPLDVGSAIAVLMDSMGHRGMSFTNTTVRTTAENRANNELIWSLFRSPRGVHRNWWDITATTALRIPTYGYAMSGNTQASGLNFGYAGDSSAGVLKRVQQVIDSNAKVCILNIGTNIGTDGGQVNTVANIQQATELLVAGGVKVIIGTVRPRRVTLVGTPPDITPAQMARILYINEQIRANWQTWGASRLWDPWEALRDPQYGVGNQLYGSILPAYAIADGVHINPKGAYVSSLSLDAQIAAVVASGQWFDGLTDLSPAFGAAGGTIGLGAQGSIPAGWSISNAQGAALPVTIQSAYSPGNPIVLDITSVGGGSANTFNVVRLTTAVGITAGYISTDWVVALWDVEVSTPSAAMVAMQATLGQTSTISARGMGQTTAAYNDEPSPITENTMRGWIATEPLLIDTRTSLSPRLDISTRVDLAGVGQVKVHDVKLVKVPNPITAYPWVPNP